MKHIQKLYLIKAAGAIPMKGNGSGISREGVSSTIGPAGYKIDANNVVKNQEADYLAREVMRDHPKNPSVLQHEIIQHQTKKPEALGELINRDPALTMTTIPMDYASGFAQGPIKDIHDYAQGKIDLQNSARKGIGGLNNLINGFNKAWDPSKR